MPQPIRDSATRDTPALNAVRARPQIAIEIANVCANWAHIEQDLVFIYAELLGDPSIHSVAFQIFEELASVYARLDLLTALCGWWGTPDELAHMKDVLVPEIRKRQNERNRIAHGLWTLSNDYPDALILQRTFEPFLVYQLNDFRDVSMRIETLHQRLIAFYHPIAERARQRMSRGPLGSPPPVVLGAPRSANQFP